MLNEFNILESKKIKHIHFIGINGISMSGLAEILLNMGYKISGSDMKVSARTDKLEHMGATIYPFHSENNIANPDAIVYTAAIKDSNPELVKARELNIPAIDRAALLGQIMKKYPFSIAISGTHGKTTTTSMISTVLLEAGLDPTIHIGAELASIGGTTKIGGDKYFVAEACEYYGSFLKFYPYVAVILNIEYDHADYFKDINHVKETFLSFASLVPKEGFVVACIDDINVRSVISDISCNKITYGIKSSDAEWSASDILFDDLGCASFTLLHNREAVSIIKLNVTGIHNVNNALAAIASCQALGCDIDALKKGLASFSGASRRFELKGVVNNIKIVDDYAHHPSEIQATLEAAKKCRYTRLWCVFQPHTYTRTKSLLEDFSVSFHNADTVILADIFAAREPDTGEVHSSILADKINACGKEAVYIKSFDEIVEYLKDRIMPGDIVITMGAGDIYKVGEMLLENIKIAAVS